MNHLDTEVTPGLKTTLDGLRGAIATADGVFKNTNATLVGNDAPGQQELRDALQEITRAARSLRVLTDYLERHPESLLRGKTEGTPDAPSRRPRHSLHPCCPRDRVRVHATAFYTLSAATEPAAMSSNLSVVVGPVAVPDEVDRSQFVVRTGPNQMQVDEFNLWTAPLQNTISRVVAQNLVALLGTPHVTLFPQTVSTDAGYRVAIEVQRFDSAPGEAATLDAVWTVRRTKDGRTETGRTTVREAVQENSYEALAAAHSRAVARLSQDIANAVLALARA